ncbi:hypothetical protein [Alteraurantiacibacter palmitatis]|uniref:Lipocalin-like domain-containing protein n=1 Tax=Alteraurantiacibacter palmitatis TaxID=2054628 RepID=A0ABV7E644_9SPHN
MMLRSLLAFLAILAFAVSGPLAAQQADDSAPDELAGAWDMQAGGVTIFRFHLEEPREGEWRGRWSRPQTFNSDGNAFYNIRPGIRSTASMTALEYQGAVELAFDDPRPGAIPDIFRFRLTGPDSAQMIYVGTDLAPYALVRAAEGEALGGWEAGRVYRRALPGDAMEEPSPPPAEQEAARMTADFLEGF